MQISSKYKFFDNFTPIFRFLARNYMFVPNFEQKSPKYLKLIHFICKICKNTVPWNTGGPYVKCIGNMVRLGTCTMVKKITQSAITSLIINIFSRNEVQVILINKTLDLVKANGRKRQKKIFHSCCY